MAQAFLIGEQFLAGGADALVLGDNIFYGHGLGGRLQRGAGGHDGATVFGYRVDPERYGVVEFDAAGRRCRSTRSRSPRSDWAVTGLYFYDADVVKMAESSSPRRAASSRSPTSTALYLEAGSSTVELLGRGYAWLDTGTHDCLIEAEQFVADARKAPGPEGRLPRGDRLAPGYLRRAAAARPAAGQERLWPIPAEPVGRRCVCMKVDTASPSRRRPAAASRPCSAMHVASSSRASTSVHSMLRSAAPSSSCRTTIRAPRAACCADCISSARQGPGQAGAGDRAARSSTSPWTSAATAPRSAAGSASSSRAENHRQLWIPPASRTASWCSTERRRLPLQDHRVLFARGRRRRALGRPGRGHRLAGPRRGADAFGQGCRAGRLRVPP